MPRKIINYVNSQLNNIKSNFEACTLHMCMQCIQQIEVCKCTNNT